jgi:nicotinamidase-related amidase
MGLPLLDPAGCGVVFVDQQDGLACSALADDRQALLSSSTALARTARVFSLPLVASTSASGGGGPLLSALQRALPDLRPIERRSMNAWEDETARGAIAGMERRRLLIAGMLTEACVSFLGLSAASDGYEVFVVADACGGLTPQGHDLALRRMAAAGILMTSWLQVLLELQRDWTRRDSCDGARAIVEEFAGGHGIDPAQVRHAQAAGVGAAAR